MPDFASLEIKEIAVEDTPFVSPSTPQRAFIDFNIDPGLGTIHLDNLQSRHFGIGHGTFQFKHNVKLIPPPTRQVHYGLAIMESYRGMVQFDNGEWIDVSEGQSYLSFNPGVQELHRFIAHHPMRVHFLQIDAEYLTSLLLDHAPAKGSTLYDFRERVVNEKFAGARSRFSSPQIRSIIAGMYNCPLDGALGSMMLEGGLQQLLALQFAALGSEAPKGQPVRHRDRDTMNAVKEHLDATFLEDHTLADLSKKFGINQNKLKTQFRELFGVPVIGYLYNLRMEHARHMLVDQGMFVSEVSSIVGYRNSNHFATAFKRKFGIIPSKLKN